MARRYVDFAKTRRARLSPQGKVDLGVFHSAYAFGRILADARKARNFTQADLAQRSGVTQADISRIERCLLAPTSTTIMRLVDALDGDLRIELRAASSA